MSKAQINWIGFLIGLLVLCTTLFRKEVFYQNLTTVWLFWALVPISIIGVSYFLSKLAHQKCYLFILIFATLEIVFVSYYSFVAYYQKHQALGNQLLKEWNMYARNLIQYDASLARFDPKLGYILKADSTTFSTSETTTHYTTNSLGVRDDEKSVKNPHIILLGDSFTMGWGVEQNQTYGQLIERKLHTPALNIGVSSYGTIREKWLLQQVNLDSCDLLIIQYCSNDFEENKALLQKQKSDLTLLNYQQTQFQNLLQSHYYPFQFIYNTLKIGTHAFKTIFVRTFINKNYEVEHANTEEQAKAFFKVIEQIRAFYKKPIIIINVESYQTSSAIINSFEAYCKKNKLQQTATIDVGKVLSTEDYFAIDDHINAQGHQKIANELVKYIKEKNYIFQ